MQPNFICRDLNLPPPVNDMKRQERILDIQENFETIYKKSFILFEKHEHVQSQGFIHELSKTISKAEEEQKKLGDRRDPFITDAQNHKIIGGFKAALKEVIDLLQIIMKIENSKNGLNSLQLKAPSQPLNKALMGEIKNSEKRLQRIKAGVKLPQVLHEQLENKMKQVRDLRFQALAIDGIVDNKRDDELVLDRTAINILQNLKQPNKTMFVNVVGQYQSQKRRVEDMMQQCVSVEGSNKFDFEKKYANLMTYFHERFKLANIQMGDEQINEFLRSNQLLMQDKIVSQDNAFITTQDPEKEYLKELDPKNFINEPELEENTNTLKKILRVNQDIKRQLMIEDHQINLQAISDFKIQQKQNHWDNDLAEESTLNIQKKFVNLRMQSKQQKRPGTQAKSTASIRPASKATTSSLAKKQLFYQAHPNFPLIKDVYSDCDRQLAVQEERIRENLIPQHPQRKISQTAPKAMFGRTSRDGVDGGACMMTYSRNQVLSEDGMKPVEQKQSAIKVRSANGSNSTNRPFNMSWGNMWSNF